MPNVYGYISLNVLKGTGKEKSTMSHLSTNWPDVRLALPEVVWLEPEQYDRAQILSQPVADERQRWQTYLNALARLGLEQWLHDRLCDRPIQCHSGVDVESASYLSINDFKLCLIAAEHMLDELVPISQDIIEKTDLAADFYVILEVLEEQGQVIIRGILRHDQLVNYCRQCHLPSSENYQLPLELFDPEINHLLFYVQFLTPITAPLPAGSTLNISAPWPRSQPYSRTLLSQWLQGIVDDNWLTLDRLIHPDMQLALSIRNSHLGTRRGRLIDLGMQLGTETVALLVTVTPHPPAQFTVLIQLHPTGGDPYLPTDLKLMLYSRAGKLLQEVIARSQDNYIQLKPFKGEIGKQFSVAISLEEQQITETFEF